jgi:GNAT superfamily N-acetyltransferase
VRIRQGRRSDGELLLRGFDHLSPESRYRRFLAPLPALNGGLLRCLTDVVHHDHESMLALNEQGTAGLGVARYVRDVSRTDAAEVAFTVIDDRQGRGLGTLLLDVISARARAEGIRTFTALILAENHEMLDLLKRLNPVRIVDRACGTVQIEVPIPAVGRPPALSELLRIAVRHDVVVPPRDRAPTAPITQTA